MWSKFSRAAGKMAALRRFEVAKLVGAARSATNRVRTAGTSTLRKSQLAHIQSDEDRHKQQPVAAVMGSAMCDLWPSLLLCRTKTFKNVWAEWCKAQTPSVPLCYCVFNVSRSCELATVWPCLLSQTPPLSSSHGSTALRYVPRGQTCSHQLRMPCCQKTASAAGWPS